MPTDNAKDTSRDERGPTPEPRDLEPETEAMLVNVASAVAQAIMRRAGDLGAHHRHVTECTWALYRAKTTEERNEAMARLELQIQHMCGAFGRELVGGTLEMALLWTDADQLIQASMEATK